MSATPGTAAVTPPGRVPRFLLPAVDPGEWDGFTLLWATIFLEADGEPATGKLGVGFVVMNRVALGMAPDVHAVILGRDRRAWGDSKPYEAWSCWNDNERPQSCARLAAASEDGRVTSFMAAAGAYFRLVEDPTHGANFYLNPVLTRKIRPDGQLPSWYASDRVVATIGRHEFLRV